MSQGPRPENTEDPRVESVSRSDGIEQREPQRLPTVAGDERGTRILAKTIYRELRTSGLDERDVLVVATELLGLVAEDLRGKPSKG
jgi:hypothetical protein